MEADEANEMQRNEAYVNATKWKWWNRNKNTKLEQNATYFLKITANLSQSFKYANVNDNKHGSSRTPRRFSGATSFPGWAGCSREGSGTSSPPNGLRPTGMTGCATPREEKGGSSSAQKFAVPTTSVRRCGW